MKRLSKTRKWTGKELATLQTEDMKHGADQMLSGADPEKTKHVYNLQTFEEISTATFERDPRQQDIYNGFMSIAVWAVNNYMWYWEDINRAAASMEDQFLIFQQAAENGFAAGVDPEDRLKRTETAAEDFVFHCCMAYTLNDALRTVADFYEWETLQQFVIQEDELQKIATRAEMAAEDIKKHKPIKEIALYIDRYCALLDGLQTKATKKPDTAAGIDKALDIMGAWDGVGQFDGAKIEDAIQESRPEIMARETQTLRLRAKRIEALTFSLDKINSHVIPLWDMYRKDDINGQMLMSPVPISVARRGSKEPVNVLFSMDFRDVNGDISTTEERTPFDGRVEAAANGLLAAGNEMFTVRQIYHAMGYTGEAGAADIQKINDSISKMSRAHIYISNEQEVKHYEKQRVVYDGPMLPMERCSVFINGEFVDSAIHLLREPPLITFAKVRNQVAEVPLLVLQSPLSKTDQNLRLEDYFIREISHMKNNPKFNRKMLFSSIYAYARIKTKMQRKRAPEKIERLLKHYVSANYIKGYTMNDDSVILSF